MMYTRRMDETSMRKRQGTLTALVILKPSYVKPPSESALVNTELLFAAELQLGLKNKSSFSTFAE